MNDPTAANPAPFAAADLGGLLIGEAFLKFVIRDPVVQAYRAKLLAEVPSESSKWIKFFEKGMFLCSVPLPLWPLTISADELAWLSIVRPSPQNSWEAACVRRNEERYFWGRVRVVKYDANERATYFDKTGAIFRRYQSPREPTPAVRGACTVVADRLNFFFGFLKRGEVVAVDMDGRKVSRAAWVRRELAITVGDYGSDLFDVSDLFGANGKHPLHRGLMLRVASADGATGSGAVSAAEPLAAVRPTVAAETACEKWLAEEMRASPRMRPKPKDNFFQEAQKSFKGLSRRAFERAWANAIRATDAKWSHPGPTRDRSARIGSAD